MTENSSFNLTLDSQTTLPPAIYAWGLFLQDQGRSPYTNISFLGDINLLAKFLPPDQRIADITTEELSKFLEWLKSGRGQNIPCSPKSFSRRITSLKSFFRWLYSHSIIPSNPAESILQHSVISPLPEVLTSTEIETILEVVEKIMTGEKSDFRPYVLLKLLLETGVKKSECIALKLNHLETKTSEPHLYVRYPSSRDRNKERKINISKQLASALETYIQQYTIQDQLFPWSPRRLEYILENIGNLAHIPKHLSFSMSRWTCALDDLRKGIEPDQVRQKLGVSKIQWHELKMKLDNLLSAM